MSKMSWLIVTFGLSLILCDVADALTGFGAALGSATVIPCWSVGVIILAAGLASGQGRRSLRLTGLWIGTILPLLLAVIFSIHALSMWRGLSHGPAILASLLAVGGVAVVGLTQYVRPRESIGARGYVVPISHPKKPQLGADSTPARRSEAG